MEFNDEIFKELFPEFKAELDIKMMKQMSVLYAKNFDYTDYAKEIILYPWTENERHVLFEKYPLKKTPAWNFADSITLK